MTERDVKSTSMGKPGADIELSEEASRLLHYNFECKSRARSSIYGDFDQAAERLIEGETPCVVIKINGRSPLAVIDLEVFLRLNANQKNV